MFHTQTLELGCFKSEPMRIIPNQSEKRFVSRLMKNGQKSIRLNPINSETKFSIQINPNHFDLGSIRIDVSELIGLSRIDFDRFSLN